MMTMNIQRGTCLLPGQTGVHEESSCPPSLLPSFLRPLADSNLHLEPAQGSLEDVATATSSLAAVAMSYDRKGGDESSGIFPASVSLSLLFFPLRACVPAQSPEACWEL